MDLAEGSAQVVVQLGAAVEVDGDWVLPGRHLQQVLAVRSLVMCEHGLLTVQAAPHAAIIGAWLHDRVTLQIPSDRPVQLQHLGWHGSPDLLQAACSLTPPAICPQSSLQAPRRSRQAGLHNPPQTLDPKP